MKHDTAHEEKQNAALRFLANELGKHVRAEVDLILGSDEPVPPADGAEVVDLSELKAAQ